MGNAIPIARALNRRVEMFPERAAGLIPRPRCVRRSDPIAAEGKAPRQAGRHGTDTADGASGRLSIPCRQVLPPAARRPSAATCLQQRPGTRRCSGRCPEQRQCRPLLDQVAAVAGPQFGVHARDG